MGAIAEMVPDVIWDPDFFGPREIWSPRNLDPKKFGSCGAQISWGPSSLGTKKVSGPNDYRGPSQLQPP